MSLRRLTLLGILAGWGLVGSSFGAAGDEVAVSELPPGKSLLRHHSLEEYGGTHQVWTSAQDSKGFLYFLDNSSNLLQYDGATWQKFLLSFPARRLLIDREDRIFLGGQSDFGLVLGEPGHERFFSFLGLLPEPHPEGIELQEILQLDEGVLFVTAQALYLFREDQSLEVLARLQNSSFRGAFLWKGEVYLDTTDEGFFRWTGGGLVAVNRGDGGQDIAVNALLPYDDDTALVFSQRQGVFRLREDRLEAFPVPTEARLREALVQGGVRTSGGRYLLATLRAGALLLDSEGALLETFDESRGEFLNNTTYHALEDRQGTLWLATDFGIVQIPRSPARLMVAPSEVEGTLHRSYRHRDNLYVATRTRLYRQTLADFPDKGLEEVPGIDSGTWFLLSVDELLLAATFDGLFVLDDRSGEVQVEKLCSDLGVSLFRSRLFPEQIFAGTRTGLRILERDGETWKCGETISGIDGLAYEIVEGADQEMILRTSAGTLYVLTFPDGLAGSPEMRSHPLPGGGNEFLVLDGDILLSNSVSGVYRYQGLDAEGFPFEADPRWAGLRPEDATSQLLVDFEEDTGRLWIETNAVLETAVRGEDGRFERERTAAGQLNFWCDIFRVPGEETYWLTNISGVHRWTPGFSRHGDVPSVHLRRIHRLRGQTDVLAEELAESPGRLSIPYDESSLRFEYAAPVFDQLLKSEYQTKLEGYDKHWSSWTTESAKEYTNLREGGYRFRVRTRDRWNRVGDEAQLAFVVRPPFFRSLWAYLVYAFTVLGLVIQAYRLHLRKLAHQQAINRRLLEVDRLKDEFLANTSHELRTPLFGIVGLAESLLGPKDLPAHARKTLETIVQGGQRLSHLVDDILDFSKLQGDHLLLRKTSVELHALTDVVLALSRPLAAAKGLELINGVESELPPVLADGDRVEQVLHNLLGNAIKFTEEGEVEVTAAFQGKFLEIQVRDTGIGIAQDEQERIFESFVQLDASIRRQRGGTGFGLAISKQLVELHGSTLEVESSPGEGSTFSFCLPIAPVEGEPGTEEQEQTVSTSRLPAIWPTFGLEEAPAAVDGEGALVLVVDDEVTVRQVLQNHLVSAGYRVVCVSSGAKALRVLERHPIDLVLLDVMMPRMSGYEVCRTVRETRPVESLPILFLSAMNRSEDRIAALDQGGNDYLSKPIAKAELLSRVRTHLGLLDSQRSKEQELGVLRGLLPICVECKKIRDDDGYWSEIETYISRHSQAEFSHGMCLDCAGKLYPDYVKADS